MNKILPKFETLTVSEIIIEERLRNVSEPHVEALMESIKSRGLQTPLIVNIYNEKYHLIAGAHRLTALLNMNIKETQCTIYEGLSKLEARLIEVDENLIRHELNPLDRANFLNARKELYLELYPETKNGGDKTKSQNETLSFSKTTAEKLGLSRRTIERSVRIATMIDPLVKTKLNEAGVTTEGDLYNLTYLNKVEQAQVINLLLGKEANSFREAVGIVQGKTKPKVNEQDLYLQKLVTLFVRADKKVQKQFKIFLETAK
jgi:ParB family chromosome partitioning protein